MKMALANGGMVGGAAVRRVGPKPTSRVLSACVLVAACLAGGRSDAGTASWIGGGANGNWTTAANWNTVPNGGDDLQFAGTTNLTTTNNLSGGSLANRSLTFLSGAGAFSIAGTVTGSFTQAAAITNNSANIQTIAMTGLALTNATPTVAATSGSLVISSTVSGAATTLTFTAGTGFGTRLTNANTYTGTTVISSGFVQIENAGALGTTGIGTIVSTGAALQLTNNITVGAEALSLSGSGAGTSNAGALRNISGNNTYGGVITLGAATRINSDSGTLTINSAGSITGNFGLTFGGAGNIVLSDPFAPATTGQTLTKDGTGNLTLSAANTYTGLTTIAGGTLTYGIANAISTGGITLTGGSTLDIATFSDSVGTVTLTSGNIVGTTGTLTSTANFATTSGTISAILAGTGFGIAQATSGTTVVTGSNVFTGASTIGAGGTLNIRNANALGTIAAGTTVSSGGQLQLQGDIAVGAEALTLSGSGISNTGALRSISGANTYGGAVTLGTAARINTDSGTLTLSGSISGATLGLTFGGAGNTVVSGTIATTTGTLTKDGGGTLTLTAANTYTGLTTVSGGTLALGAGGTTGSVAGNIANNAALAFNRSNAFTYSGTISGNGSLFQVGSGTLTLSSSNSYSGSNVLSAGTVRATNQFALGVGGAADEVILTGGALQLAADTATTFGPDVGYDSVVSANTTITSDRTTAGAGVQHQLGVLSIGGQTLSLAAGSNVSSGTAGLAFAGLTTITASPTFDTGTGTELLLNGGISGTTNITKTGAGTLTLGAGSGHANTTVSAGRLNVNFMSALGTSSGTLSLAAGTSLGSTATSAVTVTNAKSIALGSSLTFVGPTSLDLGSGTTTLSVADTAIAVTTGTLTLGGNVVGNGLGITKSGSGVLRLTGLTTGAYTGNTTVSEGELFLDGTSTLAGGTNTTVTVTGSAFLRVGASASTGSTTIVSRAGGVITSTVIDSNIIFTQSGTLTSSDANINGSQTIDSGVDVAAPANYIGTIPASPVADRIIVKNNATLRATTGFTLNPNQGILLESGTGRLAANSGAAMIIEPTVSGSGTLLKTGAGNIRLTGSNTYTGGTRIEQGIVGITSDAALGAVSSTVRNLGGELVAAQTVSGGTISGVTLNPSRAILVGNGTTSAFSAQTGLSLTYAGAIAEENGAGAAGNIRVGFAGPREGTVILTGSNSYQGSTLIHAGTLEIPTIADGGQASPLGRSSNAAGNLLIGNATLKYTGANGSTDRLFTIAKEAATTHNSTIEVATGTLAFTNTGVIAISGTGQRSLTLTGSGFGSIAGSISGTGTDATELRKTGSGRWTLTGNNAYTGDTHLDAGRLVLDGTNQTANVIVAAGATLSGHGTMAAGTLSGNGLVEPGASPGILTFADLTASGSLSFAFEFTQSGTNGVAWSSATASNNDVLRLTDTTSPFNTNLTATNVIDIYINVAGPLAIGETFIGGFFTDRTVDFSASVQNADFNIWVRPRSGAGTRTYNGVEYVSGDEFFNTPGTFQVAAADFSSGTVNNGYTLQFVAVPEPSTWALGAIGVVGLVAPRLLRRRRVAGR